ncbi:MAG: NAD(P)/FAD-dependent oxidoreductase [Pseudomonadota bacterium]
MTTHDMDVLVIGAGVVGLACARRFAMAGRDVVVVEAEAQIATHTSSRNSEVIHAGIYYAQGSLKARLCVDGRRMLYAYLERHGVEVKPCGKLVVAMNGEEQAQLETVFERARNNGVEGLERVAGSSARELEPALSPDVVEALYSPVSGIFDSHAYFLALQGEMEDHGGTIAFNSPVEGGTIDANGAEICIGGEEPMTLKARLVINAAGHNAIDVADAIDGDHRSSLPTPRYVKGSYFTISGKTPFSRLIYPVPTSASLGLHLTIDLAGRGKLGPDAEWLPEDARPPFDYQVDPARAQHFHASVSRFWPGLRLEQLAPDYAGVRPKIVRPGEPSGDFRITRDPNSPLINLIGIESPGLTSSLAIAEYVASLTPE